MSTTHFLSTKVFFSPYWLHSVQFSSVAQSCPTLWDPMDCSTLGLPVNHQLLEFTQTHIHWVGDAIQPSHPLSSPSLTLNLSQHHGFSNESVLHIRWPKYWSFSFNSPSNEHSGLISFRMDRLDLLTVQETLKSLLQHHSSKPSILWYSAFFIVQLTTLGLVKHKGHSDFFFECTFSSVQFSHSVMSDSLQPHELQHAPIPEVHSNSCPSSRWCHPAISSSVVPFSSCSQSLPASGSFPMSQLFTWGGQSTGVSALVSFLIPPQRWMKCQT